MAVPHRTWLGLFPLAFAACVSMGPPRLPTDVAAAVAHDDMRRLETAHFIIYYPAARRAEIDRFIERADRCATAIRANAVLHEGDATDKFVIVMPEAPFNNAFVAPPGFGYEAVSVIPTYDTLDTTTNFGLLPDPSYTACHELVHYVQFQQTGGVWRYINAVFGHLYTPQDGFDPWVFEGLATHYESKFSGGQVCSAVPRGPAERCEWTPGPGRPHWPIFTGTFAAAYAGRHLGSGELSALGRLATAGNQYLVGAMFFRFLAERYGDRRLWNMVASEGRALHGWFFTGSFKDGFGVSFSDLIDQFNVWVAQTFPVRARPTGQRSLATLGLDARYGRGLEGTEAWVADDTDQSTRLVVRDARGTTLANVGLVDIVPPRTLVQAAPILVSGLSVTGDGQQVWLTVVDQGPTYQTTRLLRWQRGDHRVTEVATGLGPGAAIAPAGDVYYFAEVDGDRWSLAAYDVRARTRRMVRNMPPGNYIVGAQVSPDGGQLAASVWDGRAFVVWVIDARRGEIVRRVESSDGTPVFDPSFTHDGRLMWLATVDQRFQVVVDGVLATDAPYAVLAAREAGGTLRFLDREGWRWELAEVALPGPAMTVASNPADSARAPAPTVDSKLIGSASAPVMAVASGTAGTVAASSSSSSSPPPGDAVRALSDEPASAFDHLFVPQALMPEVDYVNHRSLVGLSLSGGDRLQLQRWYLTGFVEPTLNHSGSRMHYGASAAYLADFFAPIHMLAEAHILSWPDSVASADPKVTLTRERRTHDVQLALLHTWRETLTSALTASYTEDRSTIGTDPEHYTRLGGASLSATWFSADATRYAGVRRAVELTFAAGLYPRALSTFSGTIGDVGGALGGVVPLPFGARHTLTLGVRGRALLASNDTGLLQVGGNGAAAITLWSRSSISTAPPKYDDARFPSENRFIENLRGYEDYAITTDRAAIGDIAWRYPVIIDRGVAALWFLPAQFLRELDFEAFGAGAYDRSSHKHAAVGAAVTLHAQLLRIPWRFMYQIARRITDDNGLTQLFAFTVDL